MEDPSRPRSWLPSAVTAANLTAGFAAMLLATDGRYRPAVYMLVLAIVLDILDGRLARWMRATSEFGRQLDGFADAISFGVAPALLIYLADLRSFGMLGALVAVGYVLAGVFRLARFNLTTDAHSRDERSIGLPIPVAAGYVMAMVLMRDVLHPLIVVSFVLAGAIAMVSRWRLPYLKGKNVVTAMLLIGICNYLALVAWTNWFTFIWWNLWNVAILLAARGADRRLELESSHRA